MTKFILFGFARTGTTLLLSLLDSHPEIKAFGEILGQHNQYHADGVIPEYNGDDTSLISYNTFLNQDKGTINDYMSLVYNRENWKAVGFKLVWDHIVERSEVRAEMDFSNIKVIMTTRNPVATPTSRFPVMVLRTLRMRAPATF